MPAMVNVVHVVAKVFIPTPAALLVVSVVIHSTLTAGNPP